MTVWVLTDSGGVLDVFMSPEAAQSRHQATDWVRDQSNVWHSSSLSLTITSYQTKG